VTFAGAEVQEGLRVLAADEDEVALRRTATMLEELGHSVTAFAVDVQRASEHVAAEDPDLAVVVVHHDDEHALDLIDEISSYATGPVIALLDGDDPDFVRRAADRGIDAYARADSEADMQSAIELAMRRRSEVARLSEQVGQLEGALERRAVIERAKGILMERHSVGDHAAFELMRSHARGNNRTVADCARAVLDGHALLPRR
jgi:AmiR/NasT family two-component response regulator